MTWTHFNKRKLEGGWACVNPALQERVHISIFEFSQTHWRVHFASAYVNTKQLFSSIYTINMCDIIVRKMASTERSYDYQSAVRRSAFYNQSVNQSFIWLIIYHQFPVSFTSLRSLCPWGNWVTIYDIDWLISFFCKYRFLSIIDLISSSRHKAKLKRTVDPAHHLNYIMKSGYLYSRRLISLCWAFCRLVEDDGVFLTKPRLLKTKQSSCCIEPLTEISLSSKWSAIPWLDVEVSV